MFDNRQLCLRKQTLHHVLVHPRRRPQHARAHIRNPRQLEQSLDRPILAKRPMEHRKDHIQALAAERRMTIQRRLPRNKRCRIRSQGWFRRQIRFACAWSAGSRFA